jgi:predicted nucleic acid-binding protein
MTAPWIIDGSLALNWYLTDELDRKYSVEVFVGLGDREILVPSLWIYEISNVLLVAHRRGRIPQERIKEILEIVTALALQVDAIEPERSLELTRLAIRHGLTVYDAAYLELALRSGAPIATKDKQLIRAMQAENVSAVAP